MIVQGSTNPQYFKINREKGKLRPSYLEAIWVARLDLMGALTSLGFAASGKTNSEYMDHGLSTDEVAGASHIERAALHTSAELIMPVLHGRDVAFSTREDGQGILH